MPEDRPASEPKAPGEPMAREVGVREVRLIRRRRAGPPNVWRSAGLVGLVGWSVVLPMLIGVGAGLWIDQHWPSRFSWTLMLMVAGLGAGCANAWNRIQKEQERR